MPIRRRNVALGYEYCRSKAEVEDPLPARLQILEIPRSLANGRFSAMGKDHRSTRARSSDLFARTLVATSESHQQRGSDAERTYRRRQS